MILLVYCERCCVTDLPTGLNQSLINDGLEPIESFIQDVGAKTVI